MEWHNLCDNCGDLMIVTTEPEDYTPVYCANCHTNFPDGLNAPWYEWEDPTINDWAGCA